MGTSAAGRAETAAIADRVQHQIYRLLRSFESCDQQCLSQFGVTASQGYALLAFPKNAGISMNELSQSMGLANSTMTRMVDTLVAKELAYRSPAEADRRVVRATLTVRGHEVQRQLEAARREMLQKVLGDIRHQDWAAIHSALEKLNAAIGKALESFCGG